MATNIYNKKTGQLGYQVPGSQLQPDWEWSVPNQVAQETQAPKTAVTMFSTDKAVPVLNNATQSQTADMEALSTEEKNRKVNEENLRKRAEDSVRKQGGLTAEEIAATGGDLNQFDYVQSAGMYLPKSSVATNPYEEQAKEIEKVFNEQNGLVDQSAANYMSQINTIFGEIMNEAKAQNSRSERETKTTLQRTGLSRYAPGSASTVMTVQGQNALRSLSEIAARQAAALTEAENARQEKKYQLFVNKREEIKTLKKQRIEELDKLRKEAQRIQDIQREEKRIAEEKEQKTREDIDAILQAVVKNNAPMEIRQAVGNATTVAEALYAADRYLQSEGDILDIAYKKAQIAKIYSDIEASASTGGLPAGVDVASIVAYANEYAATGKIPTGLPKGTFGMVAQVAKEMPKSPGQILSVSTGVTPTGDAELQKAMGSLYSAMDLAKQLKELDKKRWGGVVSGTLGKVFGSEDQQRYIDLRGQIVDLLSRARSGAALTTNEEARYSGMLPGRFSESLGLGADSELRIENFISALTSDMKNKASSQGWAINGLTDVKIGDQVYKVGDIVQNADGLQGRVNADGSITVLTQ